MIDLKPFKLRPKQKKFVIAYTTIGELTYQNQTRSAIRAGYSERTADKNACQVMAAHGVTLAIEAIEEDLIKKSRKTREEKRTIAWDNYEKAKSDKDKQFWWQEVCKLDGDYIQKTEVKSNVKITEEKKDQLRKEIRDVVKSAEKLVEA